MSDRWTITIDGTEVPVREGQTLLAVLLAQGRLALRGSDRSGEPRGPLCGMGLCMDCLVLVQGRGAVRSCMETVEPGLVLRTIEGGGS